MLPTTSNVPRRGSIPRRGSNAIAVSRWRLVAIGLVAAVVCVFIWMQYTILSTNLGGLAARARTIGASAAHAKQGPTAIMRASNSAEPRLRREDSTFSFDTLAHPTIQSRSASNSSVIATATETIKATATVKATAIAPPTPQPAPQRTSNASVSPEQQEQRRVAVVDAMRFAWKSYEDRAFGADEVDPTTGRRKDNVWGGIACSLVDGMDTLYVMGLMDEFARARTYVATSLRFDHLGKDKSKLSVFETIIREVGGLLSAFALSDDSVFRTKAQELVDLLLPAFDEAHGVFYTLFNPHTKERSFASWSGYRAHIADIGTLQLEMRYLSDITGDPKYATMGDAFYKILQREGSYSHTGLFPVHFDATASKFATHSTITFGALGDSFYEYLLKVYLYSGQHTKDAYLRALYDDAVEGLATHLLAYSKPDDLYYLRELRLPSMSGIEQMDHLLCFVPGMLALGTLGDATAKAKNAKHLDLAQKLMTTCVEMYRRQPSGLSPDVVAFPHLRIRDAKYKLRPEAVESLFYLYRVTKDAKYRAFGWTIFEAIEANAKLPFGFGAVQNVAEVPTRKDNKMESFFLAETLKYHYLLQAPDDVLPLDEWVFNTEAHPFRINKTKRV